MNLVKMKLLQK